MHHPRQPVFSSQPQATNNYYTPRDVPWNKNFAKGIYAAELTPTEAVSWQDLSGDQEHFGSQNLSWKAPFECSHWKSYKHL